MKLLSTACRAAALLAFAASAAGAQVTGSLTTTGCFRSPTDPLCSPGSTATNGTGLSFSGTTQAFSGGPAAFDVNLGSVSVAAYAYNSNASFNQPFTLFVAFTAPPTSPPNQPFGSYINGMLIANAGTYSLDFSDNSAHLFTYNGGSFYFNVNDPAPLTHFGSFALTGTISRATTTPEPSSLALLGTGIVGLVPMVRRKRR